MKLNFKPRARLIKQLGEQLIANEKIAISELVKNAYDACASKVKISFENIDKSNGKIIIEDNGKGMDIDIIQNSWLEIGSDYKEKNETTDCGRIAIGEKGIGRFGVHKLGNKIKLITKTKNSDEIFIEIDWDRFDNIKYLDEYPIEIKINKIPIFFTDEACGTYIEISSLKKVWNKTELRNLYRDVLSLTTPPFENIKAIDNFDIEFNINNNWLKNLPTFDDIKKGGLWYFYVNVKKIDDIMQINDFTYEFRPYSNMSKLSLKEKNINDIIHDIKIKKYTSKKEFDYISIGGVEKFRIEGYIFYLDTKILKMQFPEIQTIKKYLKENGGVRVYRDGLRVYDYGETGDDWLELDTSRINAPTKSFGNRTILSAISLEKKYTKGLKEKTNREGFVEDKVFEDFKDSVLYVLDIVNRFVNEDKSAIKNLYLLKERDIEENTITILDNIQEKIENNNLIQNEQDKQDIINHLNKAKNYYIEMKENLLKSAGAGLSYALITHEIEKIISNLYAKIKNEKSDIKDFILHLKEIVENLSKIFRNDKMEFNKVSDIVNRSLRFFRHRFKYHNIEVENKIDNNIEIKCVKNMIVNSLMNLYDNSLFWFKFYEKELKAENKPKKILIFTKENDNYIDLVVCDSGFGFNISTESAKLPFKTGKPAGFGMGLGLYFVDEIIKSHNGDLRIVNNLYEIPSEYQDGAIVVLRFYKGKKDE